MESLKIPRDDSGKYDGSILSRSIPKPPCPNVAGLGLTYLYFTKRHKSLAKGGSD